MEKPRKTNDTIYKYLLSLIAILVVSGLSFYGGIHYQKGKQTTSASQTISAAGHSRFGGGGFGGRFGGIRPTFGAVSAVSSTSITVTSSTDNSSKTFSIDSSTQITNGGQTASVSDIQTGDTVIVRTSSSTSTTAAAILLNPSFGPGASGSSSGDSTTN